jgi:hypothetical protein
MRIPACQTCGSTGAVIRGPHLEAITPKLGEAGTDDCPRCGGLGYIMDKAQEAEEAAEEVDA